jgi:glycosyltransferase involved in cell wall biosynthesis
MRILFLTQWFEPEPAFKGVSFAAELMASGHAVEVATGFPNYPRGKIYPGYRVRPYQRESIDGIVVHRLALWPSHSNSSLGRVANYLSFFLTTLLFGLVRGRRYDLVYVYHPPITPAAAAAIFCAFARKPLVVEIQDLWPDSVVASGMGGKPVARVLGAVCDFVYRRATMIVPQSDRMLERLRERGVPASKLQRIYNWATFSSDVEGELPTSTEDAFRDRFNVVYGGNLGQAQALDSLIDAVALAGASVPALHLHLFGNGIERERIAEHAARVSPSQVTLHGALDRRTMDRVFEQADVLAVQLKDDPLYAITIPSKVQHYLACGRPIVAALTGEAAELLRRAGAALVCPPADAEALANAIRQLAEMSSAERQRMGASGRMFYNAELGFDRAISETLAVMQEAVQRYGSNRRKQAGAI